MSHTYKLSADPSSPSQQGGKGWVQFLKILIALLTALAGSLGIASCTQKEEAPSTPPKGELTAIAASIKEAPSTPPKGELTDIAASIMPCHYENVLTGREG